MTKEEIDACVAKAVARRQAMTPEEREADDDARWRDIMRTWEGTFSALAMHERYGK